MLPTPERDCDYNLGDIILGMPIIAQQCIANGARLEYRLPVIVTHGLCHVLGYQHGTRTEYRKVNSAPDTIIIGWSSVFISISTNHKLAHKTYQMMFCEPI